MALVPVMGPPAASMSAEAMRESGQRSATRPVLPVTFSGRRCVASTTSVSAPGQNLFASVRKASGTSRISVTACSTELTRIGSARVSGRPFMLKHALDGGKIERIGGKAVEGVGRNRDDAAAPMKLAA